MRFCNISILFHMIRKYAGTDGIRYFWEARFITATFDANPQCLVETDRMLKNEAGVLRFFTVKLKSGVDRATGKSYKNPYLV